MSDFGTELLMSTPAWQAETEAAGVEPGVKLVFAFAYDGSGQVGTVAWVRDGVVGLTNGRRIRWAAVLFVRDPGES